MTKRKRARPASLSPPPAAVAPVWTSWLAGAIAFLAPLTLYLLTVAPDITLVDAGELALAAAGMDPAHPPGFPIWVVLGWLVTRVPGAPPILALNWLSAAAGAAAVYLLWRLCLRWLKIAGARGLRRTLIATGTALTAAAAYPLWGFSVFVEVYTLNAALLIGSFLALTAWVESRRRGTLELASLLLSGALACHHITAVLALPAWGWLFRTGVRRAPRRWRTAAIAGVITVVPALALYASLLLMGRADPVLGWGGIVNLKRLWWHISGKQYRSNLFTFSPVFLSNETMRLIGLMLRSWTPIALIFAAFGMWKLVFFPKPARDASPVRLDRSIGLVLALLIACGVGFAMLYDIDEDKEAYYITVTWALMLAAGIGVEFLEQTLKSQRLRLATLVLLAAPLVVGSLNYRSAARQNDDRARTLVEDMTVSIEPGGLLLTMDWQFYAPWLALHHLESYRPDLAVVDVNLVRRSWYLDFLERELPELTSAVKEEAAAFRAQLYKFEHDEPYDGAVIQRTFLAYLNGLIAAQMKRGRAVHLSVPMEPGVGESWWGVPWGLSYRLYLPTSEIPPSPPLRIREDRRWVYDGWDIAGWKVYSLYRQMIEARIKWERRLNRPDEAARYQRRLSVMRKQPRLKPALNR